MSTASSWLLYDDDFSWEIESISEFHSSATREEATMLDFAFTEEDGILAPHIEQLSLNSLSAAHVGLPDTEQLDTLVITPSPSHSEGVSRVITSITVEPQIAGARESKRQPIRSAVDLTAARSREHPDLNGLLSISPKHLCIEVEFSAASLYGLSDLIAISVPNSTALIVERFMDNLDAMLSGAKNYLSHNKYSQQAKLCQDELVICRWLDGKCLATKWLPRNANRITK